MAVTPLVAIVGRPNVGKSSLFNRLIGRRQAITHDVAGTTRDANYGVVTWNGKHLMLADTAGLHPTKDELELRAQDQITEVAEVAQLILVVIDATTMITNEDRQAARQALKTGKPVVLALNKLDGGNQKPVDEFVRLGIKHQVEVSAIHGRGTGDLLDVLVEAIGGTNEPADDNQIRLALLGRPNVGKSSLLNSMVGKQQAIVSATAGTTRDVGRASVRYHNQDIQILDTAGLRRRGKIEGGVEKYSALRTLAAITQADVCVLVMDATELSVAGDQNIAGQVLEAGKGLIIVVNKWDAVDKETGTQEALTRKLMHDFSFAHWAPLVYTSATEGLNVAKLFELTRQIVERRTTTIPTTKLNKVLGQLTSKQPPAGLKNRQPKIKYAAQTDTNPPTFTIFSSYADLIHFSYKRYLENGLREAYDFTGTPIKLEFRSK
ncbi:ribosome biogenesis GTPase Der [Patescibacteria group bacterium]|nr:MAG: ribosome biogenesis GTPase Der [Patescibacteria group bacterium]